jgi:outer membrane phospholipase A
VVAPPGDRESDNNADVGDYAGRLEVQAVLPYGANVFSATARNNLKNSSNTPSRTSVQADWAFPLYGQLHGYVQSAASSPLPAQSRQPAGRFDPQASNALTRFT